MPAPEVQIAGAVQAAPADQRESATVIGFDAQGKHTTLRKGTGHLVCLADDPREDKFNVACYHKDLEPYMARGRELAALGTKGRGPEDLRWKEIQAGTLVMPKEPRLTHHRAGQRIRRHGGHCGRQLHPLGHLHPRRDARIHRPATHAGTWGALVDVPRNAWRAHHDQSSPAEVGRVRTIPLGRCPCDATQG